MNIKNTATLAKSGIDFINAKIKFLTPISHHFKKSLTFN
jgi:hypothetical protein